MRKAIQSFRSSKSRWKAKPRKAQLYRSSLKQGKQSWLAHKVQHNRPSRGAEHTSLVEEIADNLLLYLAWLFYSSHQTFDGFEADEHRPAGATLFCCLGTNAPETCSSQLALATHSFIAQPDVQGFYFGERKIANAAPPARKCGSQQGTGRSQS